MSCGDRLFSFGKYLCLVNDLFCSRQHLALHIVFVPVIFNIITFLDCLVPVLVVSRRSIAVS